MGRGKNYLTTTCLVHFMYDDIRFEHHLRGITIAAIPNGRLQDRYNPTVDEGIGLVGRNAPSLDEDFRVRVSFSRLRLRAAWRVQTLNYDEITQECTGSWQL
ncbi:SfiI family type II restriction endonuclease [Candidatus Methylobacter favarea]